jgi:hypothetical protein
MLGSSNTAHDRVLKIPLMKRLSALATSAWAISFISFAATALILRSPAIA